MMHIKIPCRHFSALLIFSTSQLLSAETYDLVIYGGTSAGIAAAVQVKRMGGSVLVIEPTDRLGGLTTGGLGQTDIGNKQVIGGIAREFYHDIYVHYQQDEAWKWQEKPDGNFRGSGQTVTEAGERTQWTFEPSAALEVYAHWVKRDGITIVYGERLDRTGEGKTADNGTGYWVAKAGTVAKGVIKEGGSIVAITMESGKTYEGKFFMDATYEGDLMASAGVAFTVGREGKAVFGEELNGVQTAKIENHNLVNGVNPYVKAGDKPSGLLKGIDPQGPGEEHASDHRIQAYCIRMCLTNQAENRIPFVKPEGYDESWYEILFRNYEAGYKGTPWINSSMPNHKTDTNNRDGVSTDFIGQNYAWPQGSYAERGAIYAQHLLYQQGLMWTLANHPRVPEKVRNEVSKWGMTKDEFTEGNGWQQQLYVREGRRMISDVVMTQHHCLRQEVAEDAVGMGAYTMDSHNTQRYVTAESFVKNEGNIESGGFPPYPIDYRSIVPREKECANLVVPISLSASHIAFGSIRMEPVFMILGQSGATAVMQAIAEKTTLLGIDRAKFRERLLADKQVLDHAGSAPKGAYISEKEIKGIVVDDEDAELSGNWISSTLASGIGKGYRHDGADSSKLAKAVFKLKAAKAGTYAVQMASSPNANRSTKTLVKIGGKEQRVNQRSTPAVDGLWIPLGTVELEAGAEIEVEISNEGADGHVIVDAVRMVGD